MLIIILTCILAVSSVSAADNVTDDVVSADDNQVIDQANNDEVVGIDDGTFTALQNKIKNAGNGATIILENDYVYNEGFSTDGIDAGNKQLTIDGNGHTINGLSKSRIFSISSDRQSNYAVTLKNIVFCNGYADEGGAIYATSSQIFGSAINIDNCTFNQCCAVERGGAICLSQGKYLCLSGCVFNNNQAGQGGAFVALDSSVENCVFFNNSANLGGAFWSYDSCSVNGSIFTANHAKDGGAIYSRVTDLNIDNCTFHLNTCTGYGGAIYDGYNTIIKNSQFDGNRAEVGGAISIKSQTTVMTNCIFKDNVADSCPTIYVFNQFFTVSNHNYTIINSNFNKGCVDYGCIVIKDNQLRIYYNSDNMRSYYDYYASVRMGSHDLGIKPVIRYGGDYVYFSLKDIPAGVYDCEIISYYVDKDIDENEYVFIGQLRVPLTIPSNVNIKSSDVTKYYGGSEKYIVYLTDNNKPLVGVKVKITLNGKNYYPKTDSNGKASIALDLPVGNYDATSVYGDVSKTSKVVVKKATPKLTASQKTFKKSVKTKQYTVTLKTNMNKAMSGKYVTLNVNKKTYKVKTNSKGQATFKITNLNKKGTFKAVVKYAGDKSYNSKTVNTKIIVK